jgi:hypothetical protein
MDYGSRRVLLLDDVALFNGQVAGIIILVELHVLFYMFYQTTLERKKCVLVCTPYSRTCKQNAETETMLR